MLGIYFDMESLATLELQLGLVGIEQTVCILVRVISEQVQRVKQCLHIPDDRTPCESLLDVYAAHDSHAVATALGYQCCYHHQLDDGPSSQELDYTDALLSQVDCVSDDVGRIDRRLGSDVLNIDTYCMHDGSKVAVSVASQNGDTNYLL